MKNIVGKKVREYRKKSRPRLSQEQLSAKLQLEGWKISRGTLAKIEAGIRSVTDIEVMFLAKALKISPEILLDELAWEEQLDVEKKQELVKVTLLKN